MNDTNALVVTDYTPLNAKDYQRRINMIQEVMGQVMKDGTHFGTIPGCPKPSLYKPGSEVLLVTFGLSCRLPKVEAKDLPNGHREIQVTVAIQNHEGRVLAEGVGSCSTLESKYRYREGKRKCPKCGQETIIKGKEEYGGGWLCFAKKGGCNAKWPDGAAEIESQIVGRIENADIADQYNTVLKMAKKRAQVDAVLTATAASDIFTQDVEDMGDFEGSEPPKPAPRAAPVRSEPEQPPHPAEAPQAMPDYENQSQDPDGLEIAYKFKGPPADDIKQQLKKAGHRWNPDQRVWAGGRVIGELDQYRVS